MRGLFSVKKSVPHICAVKLTESFISPNEEKYVSLQSKMITNTNENIQITCYFGLYRHFAVGGGATYNYSSRGHGHFSHNQGE